MACLAWPASPSFYRFRHPSWVVPRCFTLHPRTPPPCLAVPASPPPPPTQWRLGTHPVSGVDKVMRTMGKGEIATVIVGPDSAYGAAGCTARPGEPLAPCVDVAPDVVLLFELELLDWNDTYDVSPLQAWRRVLPSLPCSLAPSHPHPFAPLHPCLSHLRLPCLC